MKIALAGTGAMGVIHMKALQKIDGVEVVSIASRTEESAERRLPPNGRSRFTRPNLEACIDRPGRRRRDPDHAERAARGPDGARAVEGQARPGRDSDEPEPARLRSAWWRRRRRPARSAWSRTRAASRRRTARFGAGSRKARFTCITWWSKRISSGGPISTCTASRDRGSTTCSGITAAIRSTSRSGSSTSRTWRSGARRDRTTRSWASRWT